MIHTVQMCKLKISQQYIWPSVSWLSLNFSRFLFPLSDGPVVRRLISTVSCPPSELFSTPSVRNLIGHSSEPLLAWIRKQMRAWRNITILSLPCVNGSAECRSRLKQVSSKLKFAAVFLCFVQFRKELIYIVFLSLSSLELPDPTLIIDPITEERASRTLYRIELLRRIREQVLPHPLLSERLKLCQPSPDLPEWWECGRHDRDLLLGASKHGVSRTDYHILNDPTLAFLEAHQRFTSQRGAGIYTGGQEEMAKAGLGAAESAASSLLTPAELANAAAAAKIAVAAKEEEEGEGKEVKAKEGKSEMEVKVETGDASNIPCTKTETNEEKGNEGAVGEGKDKTAFSPKVLKKEEDNQPKVKTEEPEEQKEEHTGDEEKEPKRTDDQDLTEDGESFIPADSLEGLKVMATELPEHPDHSPKAQQGQKAAEEEDREERENPDSPKSPKSADTEKTPEDDDEERMDEDDKSEKSSQEGKGEGLSL